MHFFIALYVSVAFLGVVQNDEIAALKKEIAKLRAENSKLKKQLADAEYNGFWFSETAVRSVLPALKTLPESLKPPRGKSWDRIDVDDVYKHLNDELNGKPFEARLRLKSIKLTSERRSELTQIELEFLPTTFSFNRASFTQTINLGRLSMSPPPIQFEVNEKTAKKFAKLRKRSFVLVKGQIDGIGHPFNKATSVMIRLRNLQIDDLLD